LNIYESNLTIDEILFEILYLEVLNYNNELICILPKNLYIFVEVANSMKNELKLKLNNILDNVT
jgi:hypothetical protein